MPGRSSRNEGFALADIGLAEQELTVQVGQVDGVEVDLSVSYGLGSSSGLCYRCSTLSISDSGMCYQTL